MKRKDFIESDSKLKMLKAELKTIKKMEIKADEFNRYGPLSEAVFNFQQSIQDEKTETLGKIYNRIEELKKRFDYMKIEKEIEEELNG